MFYNVMHSEVTVKLIKYLILNQILEEDEHDKQLYHDHLMTRRLEHLKTTEDTIKRLLEVRESHKKKLILLEKKIKDLKRFSRGKVE